MPGRRILREGRPFEDDPPLAGRDVNSAMSAASAFSAVPRRMVKRMSAPPGSSCGQECALLPGRLVQRSSPAATALRPTRARARLNVCRRQDDRAVGEPDGAARHRRHAGDVHRRAGLQRHLHQRGVREIADRLAVGREERRPRALGARDRRDLHGVQAAEIQPRRGTPACGFAAGGRRRRDEDDRLPIGRHRHAAARQPQAIGQRHAQMARRARRIGALLRPEPPRRSRQAEQQRRHAGAHAASPARDGAGTSARAGCTADDCAIHESSSHEIGGALPSPLAVFRQALADDAVERRRRRAAPRSPAAQDRAREWPPMMLAWLPASKARRPSPSRRAGRRTRRCRCAHRRRALRAARATCRAACRRSCPRPVSGEVAVGGTVRAAGPAAGATILARPKSSSVADDVPSAPDFAQHDVARLQVAMQDAGAVRLVEGAGDLGRVAQRLAERQRPARQPRRQRLAVEVLHDEELTSPSRPTSWSTQMFGWSRLESGRASRSKRAREAGVRQRRAAAGS